MSIITMLSGSCEGKGDDCECHRFDARATHQIRRQLTQFTSQQSRARSPTSLPLPLPQPVSASASPRPPLRGLSITTFNYSYGQLATSCSMPVSCKRRRRRRRRLRRWRRCLTHLCCTHTASWSELEQNGKWLGTHPHRHMQPQQLQQQSDDDDDADDRILPSKLPATSLLPMTQAAGVAVDVASRRLCSAQFALGRVLNLLHINELRH